jgi:gas vesicle protein
MTTIFNKMSWGVFFALAALVFAPLGGNGPKDLLASEVDMEMKAAKEKREMKEAIEKKVDEEVNKEKELDEEAMKALEDKVKFLREEIEKKMEERLAMMFEDEEMMEAVAKLQEAEDELDKNGGDSWSVRPFAPRGFDVRPPEFFFRPFNPFRVRPLFFFDDDFFFREDDDFIGKGFFEEEREDD